MKQARSRFARKIMVMVIVVGMLVGMVPLHAHALTSNPAPAAKVSFTFDDGLASTFAQAQPILAKYGLTGTSYIITGCVGMTTAPNTCRANTDRAYMSWSQIQQLQNSGGWEIGSHTVDHDCLATSAAQDPSDCQTNQLTPAQIDAELSQSKAALAANGVNATDFSPPYGDYNNQVLATVGKYYASMRGFKDQGNNIWPYDDYLLNDLVLKETVTSVANVEAKIDDAIAHNYWLVLTLHDITPTPSQDPENYQYSTAELDQIAAYVAAKQAAGLISPVHVKDGLVTSDTNLLPNGTFNDGVADGWTTDDATDVTADNGSNGSYPDPTNSIKLTSPATGNAHLFSPKVSVDPYTTYLFKNFLNVQAITSGQVAFYVDEYNAAGNWISGQYLKQETTPFVEDMNFTYKPSSAAVSKASLQVISGGSGITAYLDNAQMFPLSSTTNTNLVANGTFDAGIANGWTTDDPVNITADNGSHGSPANPVNSVSLVAGTAGNTHLFSPHVAVSSAHSYNVNAYLNIAAITSGEVGFYVDEYDSGGNWISGKYITGVSTTGAGNVGFTYTPQSANVATASLQVIVVGNSGIHAYFDDVRWYQN